MSMRTIIIVYLLFTSFTTQLTLSADPMENPPSLQLSPPQRNQDPLIQLTHYFEASSLTNGLLQNGTTIGLGMTASGLCFLTTCPTDTYLNTHLKTLGLTSWIYGVAILCFMSETYPSFKRLTHCNHMSDLVIAFAITVAFAPILWIS